MVSCLQIMPSGHVVSGGDVVSIYSPEKKTYLLSCWNSESVTDLEVLENKNILIAQAHGVIIQIGFPDIPFPNQIMDEGDDNEVMIMDPPAWTYESHSEGVYKVKKSPVSPDHFASCSVDTTVKIWKVGQEQPLFTISEHFGYVNDLLWTTENHLISGSFDGSVRVWDPESGKALFTLQEHSDRVNQIQIDPGLGKNVLSAGNDGMINCWSLEDGRHLQSYELSGRIVQIALNSRGDKVAAATYGSIHVISAKYV